MAKKHKQGKSTKDLNKTKANTDTSKTAVSVCNQLDLSTLFPTSFDDWFPECCTAEDNNSIMNTDSPAQHSALLATEAVELHSGSELQRQMAFKKTDTSNESCVTVPITLDSWFETSNKEFLSNGAASTCIAQSHFQNPLQLASFQQTTAMHQSELSAGQILNVSAFGRPHKTSLHAGREMSSSSNIPSASTSASPGVMVIRSKKRCSSESQSVNAFDGSDSDGSDDGSDSDDEELSVNRQQYAAKFLELRLQKRPCNFWQYNSQSRGPKGRRIYGEITLKDCHVLDEFVDPVAQSEGGSGSRYAPKLRHGEGNDPRPNTEKLLDIGARISKLEDEFRSVATTKSTNKEEANRGKNRLASRICRLKKKAQHEANKVKLEGLREEHQQLVTVIGRLVIMVGRHFLSAGEIKPSLASSLSLQLENLIQSHLKFMIAGHTSEYVNTQIEKSAASCSAADS